MTKQEWEEYIDHLRDEIFELEEEISFLNPDREAEEIEELEYQVSEIDCEIFDIEQRLGEMKDEKMDL